jgi:hypothetical protein
MFDFGPRNPWLDASAGQAAGPAWLDGWAQATSWWVDPAVAGAQDLTAANERVLAELVSGIAGRFEGRPVRLSLGGRPVQGVVEWIRLRRTGDRYEARVELTDVELGDWSLESLSVAADSVRVQVAPTPRLTASGVQIAGRAPLGALVAWLDGRVRDWSLSLEDGRVTARRGPGGPEVVVEPVVLDGRLDAEVRELRWRARRLTLPAWLRLVRTVPLPPLPRGIRVVDARRHGVHLEFRATCPSLGEELDLAKLRDAIAARAGRDAR